MTVIEKNTNKEYFNNMTFTGPSKTGKEGCKDMTAMETS